MLVSELTEATTMLLGPSHQCTLVALTSSLAAVAVASVGVGVDVAWPTVDVRDYGAKV